MVNHFEKWSHNASALLTGEPCLFPYIPLKIDSIFDSLLLPDENNSTVQEILQALFAAFSTLFRRMVADHLGGTYECITDDEIASVPKTNVVSERDFAQLDRLLRQKPNASTLALEAMILFTNNKTASWLKSKTETEIADLKSKDQGIRVLKALSTSPEGNVRGKSKNPSASEWALANERAKLI